MLHIREQTFYNTRTGEVKRMAKVIDEVDVIYEMKLRGEIIPMRFRIMNEDGEYESYTIKGYREIVRNDAYTTQDGLAVCSADRVFECRVVILEIYRTVRLYFHTSSLKWRLAI